MSSSGPVVPDAAGRTRARRLAIAAPLPRGRPLAARARRDRSRHAVGRTPVSARPPMTGTAPTKIMPDANVGHAEPLAQGRSPVLVVEL